MQIGPLTIYLLFEILLGKKIWIWINPRFSVPRRNLENSFTAILVARPSLRRMGPAAVMMSTQEDRISPVLSFPSGWCNTNSTQVGRNATRFAFGCCSNIPDLKKDILYNLRLLPTFAGVLRKKIRTRAGFNKILTNYISEESLINGVYDKNIV